MRIHGKGTLPRLLEVVREQLMVGNGIRFATDSFDVANRICALADRMGARPTINIDAEFGLEGIEVLPAPEPSQARH
jgi:hypothetical protein